MWKILTTVVLVVVSTIGQAQSQNFSGCNLPELDPRFGSYGYRHPELHGMGVIDRLMRQSKKTCCDGGHGGECRVTSIVKCGVKHLAWLDGKWCRIDGDVTIFSDIDLPQGAFAVVCASKQNIVHTQCPTSYCATQAPGL